MTKTPIGKIASLTYGASLPEGQRKPGGIPVYGSNGVVGFHDEALSSGPGLIVGRKGSIGEVHYSPGPFWAIDTTYYVDLSSSSCELNWLYLLLKALNLRSLNKATGVPGLDRKDVHALEVRVPEPDEQIRIATSTEKKLAAVVSAYAACADQVQFAEQLSSAVFRETLSVECPILVRSADGQSPSGWKWYRLIDLARLESGHTPSRRRPDWWGGDIPWLALPDIRKLHGKYAYETTENTNDTGLVNSSARLLPVGTVCLSRTASVGFTTILGKPMATSQDFCNWICNPEKLDPEFLMYAFMASQDAIRELGSGAVHKTIYMPTISSFHVCAPEIDEQRRIARTLRERLTAAEALSTGLKTRLADIERLPQRLLAAAFA